MIYAFLVFFLFQIPLPEDHVYAGVKPVSEIFTPTLQGMTEYFTSEAQDDYRKNHIESVQHIPIETRIQMALGVDLVPLGHVVDKVSISVTESISLHQFTFTTGAISQFYIAIPAQDPLGIIVAIHGCTSSPDRVLGISPRDYTNNMGELAVKRGWIVVAPYIMSTCNYLDDFNALGDITSNTDVFGYEMMKIKHAIDFATDRYPQKVLGIYGISYGGQMAMYMSAYYNIFDFVVVSGNMVQDYVPLHRSIILPIRNRSRTGTALDLRRYMYTNDILNNYLDDGGQALIIEAGNQDKSFDHTREFIDSCRAHCNKIKSVFFIGLHETVPFFTLPIIESFEFQNNTSYLPGMMSK